MPQDTAEPAAQDLLIGTGYTLDDLSLRFAATPLSTTVRMEVHLEEQEMVETRNVLALLPGSALPTPPLTGGAGGVAMRSLSSAHTTITWAASRTGLS